MTSRPGDQDAGDRGRRRAGADDSSPAFPAHAALMLSAAAIVVGSYSPWLNDKSGLDRNALYGVDGYGTYVALGGALVAFFAFIRMYVGSVTIAALVSAVGIATYLDAKRRTETFGADYFGGSIGWGLIVVVIGGVTAFISAWICLRRRRTP